jgi:hypothetical protein
VPAVCCTSLLIAGMDVTAVNVALPAVGRDLNAPVSGLQWTIDGYTLAVAGFLMLTGSTADRIGRRRVFQAGLALVAAGGLMTAAAVMLTGVAPTTGLPVLLAAYVVFGAGFGLVNAPIRNTAVSGMPRAQAGVSGAISSTGRQIGNCLGGGRPRLGRHRARFGPRRVDLGEPHRLVGPGRVRRPDRGPRHPDHHRLVHAGDVDDQAGKLRWIDWKDSVSLCLAVPPDGQCSTSVPYGATCPPRPQEGGPARYAERLLHQVRSPKSGRCPLLHELRHAAHPGCSAGDGRARRFDVDDVTERD